MMDWFTRIDLWIVVIYLAAMLVVALRVARGSRDVEGYVVGNRRMSGVVLGLSVLGTFLSSITFLALPEKTFKDNWNAFVFGLALPPAALIATLFFVPLYRKQTRLSAFELLAQRFGPWARVYAGVSFLVLQLIRIGTVLLLVAFAVAPLLSARRDNKAVTAGRAESTTSMASSDDNRVADAKDNDEIDADSNQMPLMVGILVVLGALVIVYDTVGGIRAVIWTDVVQVVILLFGALWCLGQIIFTWKGGPGAFFADIPPEKISLGAWTNWDAESGVWNWAISSVLVVFIYGLTENLRNYSADQSYVQRMLAARSDRAAAASIWIAALTYVPVSLIFCLIGTALWMHAQQGGSLLPTDIDSAQAFPHFIRNGLPAPITGLLIAAVLAAAMSTVDSSLNSCSTILLVDILRPTRLVPKSIPEIITLRACTVVFGILGTSMAAVLLVIKGQDNSKALMELWWQYAGTAGGGMFGLFLLAWLMPRIPSAGAAAGVVLSIPFLAWGTVAQAGKRAAWLPSFIPDCTLNPLLIGVFGTCIVFAVGAVCLAGVRQGILPANRRWK